MRFKLNASLKFFLYRLSLWQPLSTILKFLSKPFVTTLTPIKDREEKKKKKPFYIVLTIDTEAGYVDSHEKRLWQVDHPDLYEGFYYGIKNWLHLLNQYQVKASFMLSSQCFSALGKERKLINRELAKIISENYELGYHLHPRSDHSLEKVIGKKLRFTSAKFYSAREIDSLLKAARYLLNQNLGEKISQQIVSFRWGNFGLYKPAFNLLTKNGFRIDTSVCPGRKGHQFDDKVFDWSKTKNPFPYSLGPDGPLEIPITTFKIFNKVLVVDPINHIFLEQAFWQYHRLNNASKQPFFFVMLSHSSEGTDQLGHPTKIIQTMQSFIEAVKQFDNVEFITLRQAYEIYKATK